MVNSTEPLQSIANDICQHLPDCYTVSLCMEEGAAWVTLRRRNVGMIELPDPVDKSLIEQLRDAVLCAHAHAFGEAPTGLVVFQSEEPMKEIDILTETLDELRGLRDARTLGSKTRQRYNCVCDDLDVLRSKIQEQLK